MLQVWKEKRADEVLKFVSLLHHVASNNSNQLWTISTSSGDTETITYLDFLWCFPDFSEDLSLLGPREPPGLLPPSRLKSRSFPANLLRLSISRRRSITSPLYFWLGSCRDVCSLATTANIWNSDIGNFWMNQSSAHSRFKNALVQTNMYKHWLPSCR